MSVLRTNQDWFVADIISKRDGNLTPLAFYDLFKVIYHAYRPETQILLHNEDDTSVVNPRVSMEIRQRQPVQTDKRRPLNDRNGVDWQGVFTLLDHYNSGGWTYYLQLFQHTFRFRTYGQSMAQAEEEAIALERFFTNYEPFFRYAGVQQLHFTDGSSRDLDRSSREAMPYAIRDYRVILKEITIEREPKLNLIQIFTASGFDTITETIDAVRYSESAGELTYEPRIIMTVWQGNYTFVEGVDFAMTETGLSWATTPPLPYHVTYRYAVTRGVVDVERPLQRTEARS